MGDAFISDEAKKLDIVGFEHLHLHSDFSTLDGLGTVEIGRAHV